MTNLQTLSDKLHEYNQTNSTAWAILLCTPRTDEVFIVQEDDNGKSPDWWPNNNTGETIEKALELIPKPKKYNVLIYDDKNLHSAKDGISKEMKDKIEDLLWGQ